MIHQIVFIVNENNCDGGPDISQACINAPWAMLYIIYWVAVVACDVLIQSFDLLSAVEQNPAHGWILAQEKTQPVRISKARIGGQLDLKG